MNLIKTGQWYWRDGEISLKSFQLLKNKEKQEYLEFLSTLKKEDLSSNDLTILQIYSPKVLNTENNNFFSL